MIDQSTIDKISEATKILEVVSDFVTLKKSGTNYKGCCPFHTEKTPSFNVSPSKEIFKCFGCGKGGNAVHFVMEHESLSYYDALRYLARKYHIEIQERELSPEELAQRTDRESMLVLNAYAQKYFSNTLHKHAEGRAIGLSYFRERGFRDDIVEKFQLGYSLEKKDAFTENALKNGYKKEYSVKTGLTVETEDGTLIDRFRGRVMFPIHGLSGKVVGFGGRVLKSDAKTAKYLNSPESKIYVKSNELYGIFFAKQSIVKNDCCYLVEGYTDVISMHQSGIENVVSSSGTSLTGGQIRLISRFTQNITVLYDGDNAGIKAAIRGIDLLLEEGMNVRVLLLPNGEDPDSFSRKMNAADFVKYINDNQTDFIRFKTQLLLEEAGKDPVKRALLIKDIVKSIAVIPDNIIRSVYVRECSKMLEIDEVDIFNEIGIINKDKRVNNVWQQKTAVSQVYKTEQQTAAEQAGALPEKKKKPDTEALEILRCLVRYGEQFLFQDEENKVHNVASYIIAELENDGLQLENPLHQQFLNEAKERCYTENWNAEKHFKNHQDINISGIAIDLITEPYQLSKIHDKITPPPKTEEEQRQQEHERLLNLIPRVVFEYKNRIVSDKIKHLQEEIKTAQEENADNLDSLLIEFSQMDKIRKQLAQFLGERIILPKDF
ncbi:MAG: DNA primase [Prevotellaceae bacterium]|jgi:DNA primase|nr:DNA primase [Prevotellaceae bacterium]